MPTPHVTESVRALLSNALDALDRLYDGKSEVVDVYSVLYATGQALSDTEFFGLFEEAAGQLHLVLRLNLSKVESRSRALDATDRLRLALAEGPAA